jgi:hypothetical protein
MIVCEGTCDCPKIQWIKPEPRIIRHLNDFGEPERCPECESFIEWERVE